MMRGRCFAILGVLAFAASALGQVNLLNSDPGSPTYNNPSFETPATTFVNLTAPPWELTGPRVLQDIPPFGVVPVTVGTGIFANPATVPAGRIGNVDGNQLGYIFATTYNDVITGQPTDHAFTQRTGITLQAGREYGLVVGFAHAQSQPSPDSVLTMSLFAYDPASPAVETLLATESLTVANVNGVSLTDFDAVTAPIGGSNVGKSIGIRIATHSNPSATPAQTSFDFDNVRVYIPEPASASILGGVAVFVFGPRRRRQ
jgi:hypothetical protein